MDKTILYKLTHGMYIVSCENAGCVVDAVCQISGGDRPLISVALMKKNKTNEELHKQSRFALSILSLSDPSSLIKTFGFNSSRDINKFAECDTVDLEGLKAVKTNIGYITLEKEATIENETHTVFIGRVVDGVKYSDEKPLTYGYYQEHKQEILAINVKNKTYYVCTVCGYIYEGDTLPEDFICPICDVDASLFEKKVETVKE